MREGDREEREQSSDLRTPRSICLSPGSSEQRSDNADALLGALEGN